MPGHIKLLFKNIKPVNKIGKQFLSSICGYSPKRSLLYVPGDSEKKILKASTLPADIVILDCEDGVAISKKSECCSIICQSLKSVAFQNQVGVRINSLDTEFAKDDLKCILNSPHLPDSLMLPKLESVDQVKWFKEESTKHLGLSGRSSHQLSVIGQVETPKGMMDLRAILDEATKKHSNLRFEAFVFGSDDYLASIGAVRTIDASELLFARQYFIMHVKGYSLQAIDMVDINFKDLENLKEKSEEGARMGFTGKQVIHPSQINIVNQCFSPSREQIEKAKELIKAFNEQQKTGQGAFNFHGTMIDMPSVKQAQNIVVLSEKLS